jgi:hypothetical protein
MKLHPAVACTALIVGGFLILGPLAAWAYVATEAPTFAEKPPDLLPIAGLSCGLFGLLLIVLAFIYSLPPTVPGDSA